VEGGDAKLLAADSDILSSQHGSIGGRLVTISLDLHTTGDTADGFAATGITQNVSLRKPSASTPQNTRPGNPSKVPSIVKKKISNHTNLRSVTWTKVSLKEAKIRATPKTSSPGIGGADQQLFNITFRDAGDKTNSPSRA
jgi:hypothetical protein